MLSAVALASDKEFMAYVAANGKHYESVQEMQEHKDCYEKAAEMVMHMNDMNQGVSFGLNSFSDMTDAEKKGMGGHFAPDQLNIDPNTAPHEDEKKNGRKL